MTKQSRIHIILNKGNTMLKRKLLTIISLLLILPVLTFARSDFENFQKTIPYEDLENLEIEIEIGIAELTIGQVEGNNLLEANVRYDTDYDEPKISFRKSGKTGYLIIESRSDKDGELNTEDERWELLFTTKIPLNLQIDIGLVEGQLDMTALKLTDLEIAGGLSNIELTFDEPNQERLDEINLEIGLGNFTAIGLGNANFGKLNLECGLGSATLELDGKWKVDEAELNLEVGLGSATVKIPEDLGVEVYSQSNFLSEVDLDRSIIEVRDGLYRNGNWDSAPHRLTIDAEVGLGSIEVEIVD
ncbi:hypothetical protein CEE37_00450 [candidate division LCP-89 bacterium B3_LCP]|uniref:DUF2154 domain-containing protein n=1 Tax=candidate division LCP-89 bacterium B3_LCP TaxID=2012998 RepID=A0A532V4Q4_UNCL8|nr:MAG: hypothetical protein CEE37_00450 [candidate division LCP-89 bacterium B3_LCP]